MTLSPERRSTPGASDDSWTGDTPSIPAIAPDVSGSPFVAVLVVACPAGHQLLLCCERTPLCRVEELHCTLAFERGREFALVQDRYPLILLFSIGESKIAFAFAHVVYLRCGMGDPKPYVADSLDPDYSSVPGWSEPSMASRSAGSGALPSESSASWNSFQASRPPRSAVQSSRILTMMSLPKVYAK